MITTTQMQKLIQGLKTSKNGFGEISEETGEHLEVIEDELMKRGTLAADSLDLVRLEESCRAVLDQCTHLLAIRGLVIVLAMSEKSEGLVPAFHLTTALFKTYWPDLHPQGAKQARRRKAWAADIVTALDIGVKKIVQRNGNLPDICVKEGLVCVEVCKTAEIDVALLAKSLQGEVKTNEERSKPTASSAPSQSDELDAKGRADLRRDIRSLTDRIERNDPNAGIAYRLRGYAAWLDFQSAPKANNAGVTKQQEMPDFVVEEHARNLKTPTVGALSKLEDRLYMTPDWFEGHKLAHDMAQAMDRPTIAKAIIARVNDRLTACPELEQLKYETKRPIVSDEIRNWALATTTQPSPVIAALETANPEPISDELLPQLQTLNEELAKAVSPRSYAIIKLKMARVVGANGLAEQSKMMVSELVEQMADDVLKKWDAEFYAEIVKENSAVN